MELKAINFCYSRNSLFYRQRNKIVGIKTIVIEDVTFYTEYLTEKKYLNDLFYTSVF